MNNKKLIDVFSQTLGILEQQVNDDLTYNSISEWDSTAHMMLIAELENSFDIMLDTDDIIDMSSFSQAKIILAKYEIVFD